MRNTYSALETFQKHPFFLPPFACGEYEIVDKYGTIHKFIFRRIPRAATYTGRYGLFVHDPDAHWVLIAYIDNEGQFQRAKGVPDSIYSKFQLFNNPKYKSVLTVQKCSWCGKEMSPVGDSIEDRHLHLSLACRRNLKPNPVLDNSSPSA